MTKPTPIESRRFPFLLVTVGCAVALLYLAFANHGPSSGGPGKESRQTVAQKNGPETNHRPEQPSSVSVPTGAVRGHVVDIGGRGIPRASVCATPHDLGLRAPGALLSCARTDAEGSFFVESLPPGRYALTATAPGFVSVPVDGRAEIVRVSVQDFQVRDGIRLQLRAGGLEIRGFVRDATGGTIEGALVRSGAYAQQEGEPLLGAHTFSGPDGEFVLWTDPEPWLTLEASAEGYARATVGAPARQQYADFVLVLMPEGIISGRVLRADTREPVAKAKVCASPDDCDPSVVGYGVAVTDDAGYFELRGLRAGRYKPSARTPELEGWSARSVVLGVAQHEENLEIVVVPALHIRGQVVSTDGRPCRGAEVELLSEDGAAVARQLADEEGLVIFESVEPAAEYSTSVRCRRHDYDDTDGKIVVGESSVDGLVWTVEPRQGASVRGQVLDHMRQPVPAAKVAISGVELFSRGSFSDSTTTDTAGAFEFTGVPPGRFRLEIFAGVRGRVSPNPEISVEQDDVDGLQYVFPEQSRLHVTVRDPSEQPVSSVDVVVRSERVGHVLETLENGSFEVSLPSGAYFVAALPPGVSGRAAPDALPAESAVDVVLEPGTEASITLRIPPRTATIRGSVSRRSAEPVADVEVVAESSWAFTTWAGDDKRARVASTRSDISGAFELTGLRPGERYDLRARGPTGAVLELLDVAAGAEVTLQFHEETVLSGDVRASDGEIPARFSIDVAGNESRFRYKEVFNATEGKWEISGIPPGNYLVTANALGAATSVEVFAEVGTKVDDIQLRLTPKGGVEGTLFSAQSDRPIVHQAVSIWRSGKRLALVHTDVDGRFSSQGLLTGPVSVRLHSGRSGGSTRELTTATIPPGATVRLGRLVVEGGDADRQ